MTNYQTEQQAAELWRTIDAKIDKKIAALLKTQSGIVPGVAYGSVQFDAFGRATWGGGAGGGGATTFAEQGGTIPTIANNTVTAFAFSTDTAGWLDAGALTHIVVPTTGTFLTIVQPRWTVDNATGFRYMEVAQIRGAGAVDGNSWVYYPLSSIGGGNVVPIIWKWSVIAGDYFIFYSEHTGGVGTLRCKLDVHIQQL